MKITVAMLLLFALTFALFACVREPELPPATETPAITETETGVLLPSAAQKQLDSLRPMDFGGAKFRVATDDAALLMPPNSASLLNQRLYERNRAVEEKYNVTLTLADESGMPTIYERIRTEALAGASYCELALLKTEKIQMLAADEALLNLRTVPYMDLSAPYYFADSVHATTFGDMTYAVAGDFTYDPSTVFVTYFNLDLVQSASLPDLYEMVAKGQWDYDTFLLYCEEVYSKNGSDGWRAYGYSSPYPRETLSRVLWASSGERYLTNDYGTRPALDYYNDRTLDWLDFTKDILFGSQTYYFNYLNSPEIFSQGRLLFCIAPLSEIESFTSDVEFHWGIVPIPKYEINQQNTYSYLSDDQQMACIPIGAPDLALSGAITAALFASSYQTAVSRFLTQFMNLHLPDESCGYAVKNAVSQPYYDAAFFFGRVYVPVSAATYTLTYRVISADDDFDELYRRNSRQFDLLINNMF